jgi:hypothetical protein
MAGRRLGLKTASQMDLEGILLFVGVDFSKLSAIRSNGEIFRTSHIALCHIYLALETLKIHREQQEDPLNVDIAECVYH